jgi:two-component system CheB/CheR fusion protein
VGIGASAGGLEAFRGFFENLPADSGMAFVVVLHLPADRPSMLPDILTRWTRMAVRKVQDGDLVEADTVYVPPPHATTVLRDGRLHISQPPPDTPREFRPIDGFFDTLATAMGDRAVGIILSGTGSDGALGLKAIRECGGLTIAQGADPAGTANPGHGPQFADMPAAAVATGTVDLVASVEAIPGHLLRLRALKLDITADDDDDPEVATALRLRICEILRAQIGHDFSGYKEKTFMRRVNRRMQVRGLDTVEDYVARLDEDHTEAMLLFRDLLIRVTSFFRDEAAFDTIERVVIPRLFEGRRADGTVRVWVPGCATGEEAYSLAILLREQMDRLRGPPKVQIFGTDIDEPAIATARLGRYPTVLLEGLSQPRRNRFFTRSDSGYVVAKEIRDLCTFSPHSLVRDPPFSRIDLISCRNLLIYLDGDLQSRVIPSFNYSLAENGILILGISESTARHEELFAPLDKASRIFQRRNVRSPKLTLTRSENARVTQPERQQQPIARVDADTQAAGATPQARPLRETIEPPGLMRRTDAGLRRLAHAAARRLYPDIAQVDGLRHDLRATREELQSITEEHGTALEELRSSNEELHSVNEELQSTNEELETSKEEIQSVNEELHAVNAQLSEKVDELDRANSDLRNLFESTQVATVFLDRFLVVRSYTPAITDIYSLIPSDVGRPLTDIVSTLDYVTLRQDVADVLDTLSPLERRTTNLEGSRHYILRVLPYRAPDSTVSGTLVTFLDVTTIVNAEQQQRLLVDELNHRVKNMLTVVISLASQTARRAADLDSFQDAFMGRVRALSASYALLSRENWTSIALREVLDEEMRPFASADRPNLVLDGPDVQLAPAAGLALGMAVHELATNAVKYGALSRPEGRVSVTWRFEQAGTAESCLVITWVEAGGPPVLPPTQAGFGTTLVQRSLSGELAGRAELNYHVTGLRATLTMPLERLTPRPPPVTTLRQDA